MKPSGYVTSYPSFFAKPMDVELKLETLFGARHGSFFIIPGSYGSPEIWNSMGINKSTRRCFGKKNITGTTKTFFHMSVGWNTVGISQKKTWGSGSLLFIFEDPSCFGCFFGEVHFWSKKFVPIWSQVSFLSLTPNFSLASSVHCSEPSDHGPVHSLARERNPIEPRINKNMDTFHWILGCFIGILTMVDFDPYITG